MRIQQILIVSLSNARDVGPGSVIRVKRCRSSAGIEGKSIYERRTPGGQGNSLSTSKLPYRKCFSHILPADLIC